MPISTRCQCGKPVTVNDDLAGQSVACFRCGRDVPIPGGKELAAAEASSAETESPPLPIGDITPDPVRDSLYWAFALAFIPLAMALARPVDLTLKERIDRELYTAPIELRQEIDLMINSGEADLDDILARMPEKRLNAAYLPRHSQRHWLFVLAATLVFGTITAFCFARGAANPLALAAVGLFTGTVGVTMLTMAQAFPFTGALIDICMMSAEDPDSSFVVVLIGFTLGVGVIEELCKIGPLLWYWRRHQGMPWRTACLWGLASGLGFGIAEGILYSTEYYHGIEDRQTYVVRFTSCVALHAIWAASAGITLARNRDLLRELHGDARKSLGETLANADPTTLLDAQTMEGIGYAAMIWGMGLLRVLWAVILLHGLYDTALTRQQYFLALVTAVVSFGWLAWQVESCRREEAPATEPAPA